MPKNIIQDIVKTKKTKDIEENSKRIFYSNTKNEIPPSSNSINSEQKRGTSHNVLWFVALISIVFLFFAISFLFSNATITISTKTKDFTLDKTFTAVPKISTTDSLTYDLVVLSGEESRVVTGGEEKDWEVPATGSVLIYNAFSSSSQPLAINTRLEGSNGKIYKTKSKITVPGISKNGIPGKVGVDIYGEKVGSEFNSAPLDFKILGFKGTPKYSKIYARSVGEITGGLLGKSSQLSDSEKEKTIKELSDSLSTKLLQKVKNQIPTDFVLLSNATFLNIDESNVAPTDVPGNFKVSIKGTFYGIIFNKEKLTKEIINTSLEKTDDQNVLVSNLESLSISSFDKNLITLPESEMKDITFNLSGTVKIVWKVDGEKLVSDLLGKNKKDFNQVLSQYPNIDSAQLTIKPVWENSFPSKSKDIKIVINYPQ